MIINCMIIELMIKFIQAGFSIHKFKDLIKESSAVVYQLEDWIMIERNRNFNIVYNENINKCISFLYAGISNKNL